MSETTMQTPLLENVMKDLPYPYPDPTKEDLEDPIFEAVWQAIKGWDIERVPDAGRAGATGNDVMHILNAIRAATSQDRPTVPILEGDSPSAVQASARNAASADRDSGMPPPI